MSRLIDNIWPNAVSLTFQDRIAVAVRHTLGYCVACGKFTIFHISSENLREDVVCKNCGCFNRQRQLLMALLSCIGGQSKLLWKNIKNIPINALIWNAEANGAFHERLSFYLGKNLISSEYISSSMKSGEIKDGILHVDMQETHFEDNSLDFVLSSDVLEHMPYPKKALNETFRILKPGGSHIFTVPFYGHRFTNEKRAGIDGEGRIKYLLPRIYHSDPIRPAEGTLVYNIFAPEILCDLEKIGFSVRWCRIYSPFHGVFGNNGVVIIAQKPCVSEPQ